MNPIPKKFVLVGEAYSGKTWLWQSYFLKRVPRSYTQTIFDNHSSTVVSDGREFPVTLFDTCANEDYSELRKLAYHGADVIILCVALESSHFKDECMDKWILEFKTNCKGIPFILVGTKKDSRDSLVESSTTSGTNKTLKPLKYKHLESIGKKMKATLVTECSANTGEGLELVFQNAIRLSLSSTNFKK